VQSCQLQEVLPFGRITTAEWQTAGVTQKSDYIISYILGTKWSGTTAPLSYTTLESARNMKSLLPNMPMSGDQTVTDVGAYLNKMASVNAMLDTMQNGAWTLKCLKNNAQSPSAVNGGIQTLDPTTGAVNSKFNDSIIVSSSASIASINNDLQNKSRTIDIGKGWFFPAPLKQAYGNIGKDVDGFKFTVPPAYNLDSISQGGDFGILNNVLIANYPDVTITYKKADFNSFKQNWSSVTTR